jgi:hypothetical protein
MAFDITDWNINPNQKWYVKLSDAGSTVLVELFNTLADAIAGTNRVAVGANVAFGVDVKVLLTPEAVLPTFGALAKFNSTLDYHLKVTVVDGDTTKRFAIGPFTDLPPVEDALMLTEEMIFARATLEINRGTHSILRSSLQLESHYPALELGDIVTVSSSKRGYVNIRHRVETIITQARIDDNQEVLFEDTIEAVEFQDFVRQP